MVMLTNSTFLVRFANSIDSLIKHQNVFLSLTLSYLMQHHISVGDEVMRKRAQVALDACVSLQHSGLLAALVARLASAPNVVSQIMLAHYFHHPAAPSLLNEGFRFQHDDDVGI